MVAFPEGRGLARAKSVRGQKLLCGLWISEKQQQAPNETRFICKCSSQMHDDTNLSEIPVDLFIIQVETFKPPKEEAAVWGGCCPSGSAGVMISMTLNPAKLLVKEPNVAVTMLYWILRVNNWKVILVIHQHQPMIKGPIIV